MAKRVRGADAQAAGVEDGAWVITTLPSDMDGNIRLIFANIDDPTVPISHAIDGYIYINDLPYWLVEADSGDFE